MLHPEHFGPPLAHTSGIAIGLMLFPPLISSIFPALIITNFLVYLVPPARRAMAEEDREFPGTDYNSSQRALLKIGLPVVAAAALLALAGAAIG